MQPASEQQQQQRKAGPPRSPSKPAAKRRASGLKRSLADIIGTTSCGDSAAPMLQTSRHPSKPRRGPVPAPRRSSPKSTCPDTNSAEAGAAGMHGGDGLAPSEGKRHVSRRASKVVHAPVGDGGHPTCAAEPAVSHMNGGMVVTKAESDVKGDIERVPDPAPKRPRGAAAHKRFMQQAKEATNAYSPPQAHQTDGPARTLPDAPRQHGVMHDPDSKGSGMCHAAEPAPLEMTAPNGSQPLLPRSSGRARRPSTKVQDLMDDPSQGIASSDHAPEPTAGPLPDANSQQVTTCPPQGQAISRDMLSQMETRMPMPKATSRWGGKRIKGSKVGSQPAAAPHRRGVEQGPKRIAATGHPLNDSEVGSQQVAAPHRLKVEQGPEKGAAADHSLNDSEAPHSEGMQLRKRKGPVAELQAGGAETRSKPASDSGPMLSPQTRKRRRRVVLQDSDTTCWDGQAGQSASPQRQPSCSISPEAHLRQGSGRGRGQSQARGRGRISADQAAGSEAEQTPQAMHCDGPRPDELQRKDSTLESGSESIAARRSRGRGPQAVLSDAYSSGSGTAGSRAGGRAGGQVRGPGPSRLCSATGIAASLPGNASPASSSPPARDTVGFVKTGRLRSQDGPAAPKPWEPAPRATLPAKGPSRPGRKTRLGSTQRSQGALPKESGAGVASPARLPENPVAQGRLRAGPSAPRSLSRPQQGSPPATSSLSGGSGPSRSPHWQSRVTRRSVQEEDLAVQQALEASKAADDAPAAAVAGALDSEQRPQAALAAERRLPAASVPGQTISHDQHPCAAIRTAQPAHSVEGAAVPILAACDVASKQGLHQPLPAAAEAEGSAAAETAVGSQHPDESISEAQPATAAVGANIFGNKDPFHQASATPELDAALAARTDRDQDEVPDSMPGSCLQQASPMVDQGAVQDQMGYAWVKWSNGLLQLGPLAPQNGSFPASQVRQDSHELQAQNSAPRIMHGAEENRAAQEGGQGSSMTKLEQQVHFFERGQRGACKMETALEQGGSASMQQDCPVIGGILLSAPNVPSNVSRHWQGALAATSPKRS